MTDDVQIPAPVADEIASWRRVFAARQNGVDPRDLLRKAAGDLWQILEADKTVHPETNGIARQDVVDALHDMAESAAIPPDDAQVIFAESFKAPNKPNGGDRRQSDEALSYTDIARDPLPLREWCVPDRIPHRNVAILSGEGAAGKSILLLQLSAAHVLARDWIGNMPVPGPIMYVNCEDDEDEICRRLENIAAHYRTTRKELAADLRVLSFVGRDAVLGYADKTERIRPTPLFDNLSNDALKIKPRLIVIDTVADVFSGRENDRSQTRQFITMLRGLALKANAAIIIASHPSLTGIATDTGLSGNTAWHNSVRARAYFKAAPGNDNDLRVLEWRKNNYGPVGENVLLRWRNGVYVPEPRAGSLEQLAADAKIDNLFLDLLRRFTKQGRNVTDRKSVSYAPAVFEGEPEAKKEKVSRKQFAEAMTRLFAADKIQAVTEGPKSHPRTRIVEAEK
jgi:RecA-family ATPase